MLRVYLNNVPNLYILAQTEPHSFTRHSNQRPCRSSANTPSTFSLYPQRPHQAYHHRQNPPLLPATLSPFNTSRTHWTVTALSYPQVGTAGERLASYEMDSTPKAGANLGSATWTPPTMNLTMSQARGRCTRSSSLIKASRCASCFLILIFNFSSSSYYHTLSPASPAPSIQQPDPRTSLPREELRRELQEAGPRPARDVPQPDRVLRRWHRRPTRQQLVQHAQRRARAQ